MKAAPCEFSTFDVVFICTANQARSALAAAFFAPLVSGLGVQVRSRGTQLLEPSPALPDAIAAAAALGVDLSGHRSKPLSRGELADSEMVIGFEPDHMAAAVVDGHSARSRTFMLREAAGLLGTVSLERPDGTLKLARTNISRLGSARRGGHPDPAHILPDPSGRRLDVFVDLAEELHAFARLLAGSVFR